MLPARLYSTSVSGSAASIAAVVRLARTAWASRLSEELVRPTATGTLNGNRLRNVAAVGDTPVRLSTTARARDPAAATRNAPEESAPRPPGRVSRMRTGGTGASEKPPPVA